MIRCLFCFMLKNSKKVLDISCTIRYNNKVAP